MTCGAYGVVGAGVCGGGVASVAGLGDEGGGGGGCRGEDARAGVSAMLTSLDTGRREGVWSLYFFTATCRGPKGHGSGSADAKTSAARPYRFLNSCPRPEPIRAIAESCRQSGVPQSSSPLRPKKKEQKGKTKERNQSVWSASRPTTAPPPRPPPTRTRTPFHLHLVPLMRRDLRRWVVRQGGRRSAPRPALWWKRPPSLDSPRCPLQSRCGVW